MYVAQMFITVFKTARHLSLRMQNHASQLYNSYPISGRDFLNSLPSSTPKSPMHFNPLALEIDI